MFQPPSNPRWHPLQSRRRTATLALLLALTCVAPAAKSAVVLSCRAPDGTLHFVQFNCPSDTEPAANHPAIPMNIINGSRLSTAEERALALLEQTLAKERQQRRKARARARAARDQNRARVAEACQKAKRALDALSVERRQGYRAADVQRLDAQERRWQAQRRENC